MKNILASLLALFIANICFSQKDEFTDGYIITTDSKIVFGDLAFRNGEEAHNSCILKAKNGKLTEYFPHELNGYGYVGGVLYNSVPSDSIFAKSLIKGALSLWRYKNKFYLHYSDQVFNLNKEGVESVRPLLETCLTSKEINKNLKLNERSLNQLVIRFNQCQNADFTSFDEKKPDIQLEYGVGAGFTSTSLQFSESRQYEYLQGDFESSDPFHGIGINVSSPKTVRGLSFQQEVQFSNSSFYNFQTSERTNETKYYDTQVDLREVLFPFSAKYSPMDFAGFQPYIQVGISYNKLSTESIVETTTVRGNVVTPEEDREDPFDLKEKNVTTWFGAGVAREFRFVKADFFVRYYSGNELSDTRRLEAQNSRMSFGLFLSYIQVFYK